MRAPGLCRRPSAPRDWRPASSSGAARADGTIHTAFDHDFSNFAANCEKDRRAIEALGAALRGSNRPLVITSGTRLGNAVPGQPATEDIFNASHPNPRSASELASASVCAAAVTPQIELSRKKGVSAYVGDGSNRWPAAQVPVAAPGRGSRSFRLAGHVRRAGRSGLQRTTRERLQWHPTGPDLIADLDHMHWSEA